MSPKAGLVHALELVVFDDVAPNPVATVAEVTPAEQVVAVTWPAFDLVRGPVVGWGRGLGIGLRASGGCRCRLACGADPDSLAHVGVGGLVDMGDAHEHGIVMLLDRIPTGPGFDADARESLLETFRDAADTLADGNKRFRVFYSFA